MEPKQNIETKEEKLQRLRDERDAAITLKHTKGQDKYHLNKDGVLYVERYQYKGKHWFHEPVNEIFHIEMRVKIKKPDNSWRRGIIQYIRMENGSPVFGVICSKTAQFEKGIQEIRHDDRLEKIIDWAKMEIPERLKKLTTSQLLREFRKTRSYLYRSGEYEIYRAELAMREHVGPTGKKEQKKNRQEKIKISGKRK
jgi:hypothetical protein